MSKREVERVRVLTQVAAHTLSLREAATMMQVGYRQAKRVWQRFQRDGAAGLVHRSTGRPSNRAWPAAEREAVLAWIRAELSGTAAPGPGQRFGPTLVAEQLAEERGLVLSVTTLRRWMRAAGLWSRRRRHAAHRSRRPRCPHFGELVQLDGSPHAWFEARGPRSCLLEMVDDATGRTLQHFAPQETTWAALDVLRAWITQYGVPQALYLDKHGAYQPGERASAPQEGRAGSQFARICTALGIQLITAHSPQAKGRVERAHGTHQDRLVKKMRRAGIATLAEGNAFLATYTPVHTARFAQPPAAPADFHRPAPSAAVLARLWQLETRRTVGRDGVVRYHGRELQLERSVARCVPNGARVVVGEARDGTLTIVYRTAHGERSCAWHDAPPRAPKPPAHVVIPAVRTTRVPDATTWRPAADHPWRQQIRAHVAETVAGNTPSPGGHF